MPIQGDLVTMDVADLFGWVRQRSRTGVLRLRRAATEKRLTFEGGRLRAACSNDPRETLGQALVRDGLVSEEALIEALLHQEREHRLLGEIFVTAGMLPAERLTYALAGLAEEIACDVFLWGDGTFAYADGGGEEGPAFGAGLDLGLVIEEGQHRRARWHELRRSLPSSQVRFRVRGAPDAPADAVEAALILLAAAGKTLAAISLETRRSRYETALRLHALVERGVLDPDPPVRDGSEPDVVDTIQALLASAADLRAQHRHGPARNLYEEVLALDRLNEEAQRGLIAVNEARRLSERATGVPRDKVPALRRGTVALAGVTLDSHEGFVLSRVNGQWSVAAILKLCPMPEAEVLTILGRLLDHGIIELIEPT